MNFLSEIAVFKKELSDIKKELVEMKESNRLVWKQVLLLVKSVQKSYQNVVEMTKISHDDLDEDLTDLANSVSLVGWG